MRALVRSLITGWWRQSPWGILLSVLGVALGTGVALSVHLASRSVQDAFLSGLESLAGPPGHVLRAPAGDMDEQVFLGLEHDLEPDVTLLPLIEGEVRTLGSEMADLLLTGVDLSAPADAWGTLQQLTDPESLFGEHAVVWPEARATVTRGPREVALGSRVVRLNVVGSYRSPNRHAYQPRILADLPEAQRLLERVGRIDRIVVQGPVSPRLDRQVRELGLVIEPSGSRQKVLEQMAQAFRFNLGALSLVAALLGAALTLNLLGRNFGARRSLLARLHALGATRRSLSLVLLSEGGLIGLLGGLLGLGFGTGLATVTTETIRRTVSALYGRTGPAWAQIAPADLLLSLAASVALGLLAAAWPAVATFKIPPSMTVLEHVPAPHPPPWPQGWTASGLGLLLLSGVLATSAAHGLTSPELVNVVALGSAVTLALGTLGLIPVLIRGSASLVPHRFGREALVHRLAVRSFSQGWRRHTLSVGALMLATGMIIGMGTMVGSFRGSVADWARQSLAADLFVSSRQGEGTREGGTLSPGLADRVAHIPDIARVEPTYEIRAVWRQRPFTLAGMPLEDRARRGELPLLGGEYPQKPEEVLVTEAMARHHRLHTGDVLDLPAASGSWPARVTGIVRDYASDQGQVFMGVQAFRQLYPGWTRPRSLALVLTPGTDVQTVRRRLIDSLPEVSAGLVVRTPGELRREVLRIFDETFALTWAIEFIGLAVALMGLASSQQAALTEERALLVQLRRLGLSAGGLTQYILVQAGLATSIGLLLGLGLGHALAALLVHVLNPAAFGWHLPFALQPARILGVVSLMPPVALLACIPAIRQLRRDTHPGRAPA
ncbi:MAG: ABC transporter permease [Candidatus Sericytochromatia bacterium]|nr:ABC transporter permease [Candidatus Sericytochromatia bacterium]